MATRPRTKPIPRKRATRGRVLRLTAAYLATTDGWYAAEVLGARGALTQGKTIEEARENLLDVVRTLLELAPHQLEPTRRAVVAPPGALTESLLVVLPE